MAVADAIRESMSAVMDGEASDMDLARVLKAVDSDPAARRHWQALQDARCALRTGASVPSIDVSKAVMTAISEPARSARRVGPLGSLAAAASVTMAVVFGGQFALNQPEPMTLATQVPGAVVPVRGAAPMQASLGSTSMLKPSVQPVRRQVEVSKASQTARVYEQLARERLHRYGVEHATLTATLQPNALVPFARVPSHNQ